MPFTIDKAVSAKLIVKKSRFIGYVQPVDNRAQAQQLVQQLWQQHPQARHICWALIAGAESAAVDDGEPGGTAGRPILEVLRKQQLEFVVAIVVRYFGGIKLGAGGLVRAYTDSVAQALLAAKKIPLLKKVRLQCSFPYDLEGLVRRQLEQYQVTLLEIRHLEQVSCSFSVVQDEQTDLMQRLTNLGQGKLVWN